jgi:hypothetical protein
LYLGRIKRFKKVPPDESWDGAFTYENK